MGASSTFNERLVLLFNEIVSLEQRAALPECFQNISYNDIRIIEAIGNDVSKSMSKVAKSLKITVGTLTIAINSLVKKGYVKRQRSETDKRVVLISLSDLGIAVYTHQKAFHKQMIQAALQDLSEDETMVLLKALTNLKTHLCDSGGNI